MKNMIEIMAEQIQAALDLEYRNKGVQMIEGADIVLHIPQKGKVTCILTTTDSTRVLIKEETGWRIVR